MENTYSYPFHALLHSAALVDEKLRQKLAPLDIRPKQARALDALSRLGSAAQVQLARELNVTAGSMSTMVIRLEKLGLISRDLHPDTRRSDVLRLSEAGQSQLRDIRSAWKEVDEFIAAKIGRDKARQLTLLTEELRLALGGRVPGEAAAAIELQTPDKP